MKNVIEILKYSIKTFCVVFAVFAVVGIIFVFTPKNMKTEVSKMFMIKEG